MNRSPIPWLGSDGFTWNPITGCTFGCPWCYARRITKAGPTRGGFPNGFEPTIHTSRLDEPLHRIKPATIFLGSMGDLFDPAIKDSFRDEVFQTVANTPQHRYVVLTKRAEAMRASMRFRYERMQLDCAGVLVTGDTLDPLPNLMLGVTVTNQADADARIPLLLDTPASYRMVSVEPMLGPVDLERWTAKQEFFNALGVVCSNVLGEPVARVSAGLDFVAIGAKTPGKTLHDMPGCAAYVDHLCDMAIWAERCADRDWCPGHDLRWLLDQCGKAGVPVNYKHGNTTPAVDGKVYDAMIADVMR